MNDRKSLTVNLVNWFLAIILLGASLPCYGSTNKQVSGKKVKLHDTTAWHISPSFKFDTLCFLNALTGDSYYLKYYQDEYAKFESRLTPVAKTSLATLKRRIKDENKNIISAFLTLYFSATDDQTLDDMLGTLKNSERLKINFKKTPYYNDSGWQFFESIRDDLRTVFLFLKQIQFEEYWKQNILPKVKQKIAEIEKDLPKYNVIAEVERNLGFALPSNQITVYMLYYSQPHGIKITGTRFLTDVAYPFKIVIRNAIHEMMHPPYTLVSDGELKEALETLKADTFLMDKVLNHNPSYGYNSFEGFIEEDCVQALDQLISEKFQVEREAHKRWKENDDGMHVFAVALYSVMKQENYNQRQETLRAFLIRIIRSGKLGAGRVKAIYEAFYSQPAI